MEGDVFGVGVGRVHADVGAVGGEGVAGGANEGVAASGEGGGAGEGVAGVEVADEGAKCLGLVAGEDALGVGRAELDCLTVTARSNRKFRHALI